MTSPTQALDKPWPEDEPTLSLRGMHDLPSEEKERLESETRYLTEENHRRRQQARRVKLAACPILSITLTAQDEKVTDGKLAVTIRVKYERSPDEQYRPIIAKLDAKALAHTTYGQYQIFSNGECSADACLPWDGALPLVRPARDKNGRFIRPMDAVVDATWTSLGPGDEVIFTADLDLIRNSGWRQGLQTGYEYWVKYGFHDVVYDGVKLWRYGTFEDWHGKAVPWKSSYVSIPLGYSNAVRFYLPAAESISLP